MAEPKIWVPLCPHRLEQICRSLKNRRDDLLALARRLDEDLEQLGRDFQIPTELPRRLLGALSRDERNPRRWTEEAAVREHLRGRFHEVQLAVAAFGRGDGSGQFVGGKPQQSAADLLFPPPAGTWARTIWRCCSST